MEQNNDENIYEKNKKKYKMSLLYIQTRELKNFYNSKMEKEPKAYYLIDKEWLDKYKSRNKYYESSLDYFKNFDDWKDYSDFKNKICNVFKLEQNRLTTFKIEDALDNYFNFSHQKGKIKNSHLIYPQNCELIKKEFVEDVSDGSSGFILYDIYIGNKLILINDCETQSVAFLCSLVENEENKNNFLIQIDYLLAFESEKYMQEENYFSKRKIDITKKGEKNLINKNGKKIGKIFIINDKDNNINHQNNDNNNINANNNINSLQLHSQLNENQNMDNVNNPIINNNNNNNISNNNNNINNKEKIGESQTYIFQSFNDLSESQKILKNVFQSNNNNNLKNSNQNANKTSIINTNDQAYQNYNNSNININNNNQAQNQRSNSSININNHNSTIINNSIEYSTNDFLKYSNSLRSTKNIINNNNYNQMMITNINDNKNKNMNNINNFRNNNSKSNFINEHNRSMSNCGNQGNYFNKTNNMNNFNNNNQNNKFFNNNFNSYKNSSPLIIIILMKIIII